MFQIEKRKEATFGRWMFSKTDINWLCRCLKYTFETKRIHKYSIILFQLYNKETDPYWDPPCPQLLGYAFLSL